MSLVCHRRVSRKCRFFLSRRMAFRIKGGTSIKDILDRAEVNLGRTINGEIREKFKSNWITTVKNARALTQEQWDKLGLPLALENEIKVLIAKDVRDLDLEELSALKALAQAIRRPQNQASQDLFKTLIPVSVTPWYKNPAWISLLISVASFVVVVIFNITNTIHSWTKNYMIKVLSERSGNSYFLY